MSELSGADPASEKGGGEIEKVRMHFVTLESGELHNICFIKYYNIITILGSFFAINEINFTF